MKRAKLRITLYTPGGLFLGRVDMDLNELMRETKWSPADTSSTPQVEFTWVLEDHCGGPNLTATGIFNDQGINT